MKRAWGLFGVLLVAAAGAAVLAAEATVDYPVASVNSETITRSQVAARQTALAKLDVFQEAPAPTFEEALEIEIERSLLLQAAKAYVDSQTRDGIKKYAEDLSKRGGDPKVFDPAVGSAKASDDLNNKLLLDLYLQRKLYSHVAVRPAEIREYYETNQESYSVPEAITVRQILVRFDGRTPDEAKALAEKAAARVKAGEEFAQVAKEMSQDPYAVQGGLWPPQKRGALIPQVEQAALALKPGQTSEPLSTPLGWHIVKLEEHVSGSVRPFAEVQESIAQTLLDAAQREARRQLLSELKSRAIIRILQAPADVTQQ